MQGSPPRGRGKVPEAGRPGADEGITPAWAGKRLYCHPFWKQHQDHPRVGGEKLGQTWGERGIQGSPPRRRGKGVRSGVHRCCRWITPAWAGKSYRKERKWSLYEDHPRTGGEKDIAPVSPIGVSGSPPRGRGKAVQRRVCCQGQGITPAWAGKRRQSSHCLRPDRDHPRAGGENFSSLTLFGL